MIKRIEEAIGKAAAKIAKEIEAETILSIDALTTSEFDEYEDEIKAKVIIFRKASHNLYRKTEFTTKLKNWDFGSITPVKEIIMDAISKKYLEKGDRVVCTQDSKLGFGYKGVLFIFEIDETFFQISRHKLSEKIDTEVIEAVLSIAKEIAREGREGRRVGTAFILGDPSELSRFMKQLIVNPFFGMEEKPKVTDQKIRETIKEFAQLDGVFIINNHGEILSAGTYINIDHSSVNLAEGFGTKHRACCALTAQTESIAVILSESGGIVRVIKDGRIILKL